ncbi:phage integrase SAM-like domain-containing protein [Maribacter sp. IgM3_T14_3]|uniref:phage integrase SAM-like domain-containing protein n=1 Tax=Maribacter sp. IgM3_T14_3 TaxID=3415140 RepID=UPI003C6EB826
MKITLKQKKLKGRKSSLYLELYNGYRKDKKGDIRHLRNFEYLKLYIVDDPQNAEEVRKNKEALQMAEQILTIRQSDLITGKYNMKNERKGAITFLDYFRHLKEERYESNSNYGNWDAALKHIEKFCPEHVRLNDIDTNFVKNFKKYIDTQAKTKSGTPLSQNSKYTYFNKFRAALREAYNESFIQEDVIKSVKTFAQA